MEFSEVLPDLAMTWAPARTPAAIVHSTMPQFLFLIGKSLFQRYFIYSLVVP